MSDSKRQVKHWAERDNKFKKNSGRRINEDQVDDRFDWRQELQKVEVESETKPIKEHNLTQPRF